MHRFDTWSKITAAALLVLMPSLGVPVAAGADQAGLAGVVISSADRTPLSGARVHVSDSGNGSLFSSVATDAEGRFGLDGLPASSYEVAVEVDGGLYLVGARVELAPGQTRDVDLAIDDRQRTPRINAKAGTGAAISVWNNPATAALIVLGSAFVVGAIVENEIDDEDEEDSTQAASKFKPSF